MILLYAMTKIKASENIEYDSVELLSLDGTSLPLYKINNVVYSSNGMSTIRQRNNINIQKTLTVKGPVFVFDIFGFQYYHTLYDRIAQAEFLKQQMPDLKIAFVSITHATFRDIPDNVIGGRVIEDVIKIYNISEKDVITIPDYDYVLFESIVHITQYSTSIFSALPHCDLPEIEEELYNNPGDNYVHNSTKALSCLLPKEDLDDSNSPKKIYLSRSSANKEHGIAKDVLHRYDNNCMVDGDDELLESAIYCHGGTIDLLRSAIETRILNEDDNAKIEEYFKNLGYTIIQPQGMSLLEQARLCHNATHVVSFKGTALSSVAFCKQETKVFILNLNNEYRFFYPEIVMAIVYYVAEFPKQTGNFGQKYTFEDIKYEIESNFINLI